mgnify:FL=1
MSNHNEPKITITMKKYLELASYAIYFQNKGCIAGQAMTEYQCRNCDQEFLHSNTAVPVFCRDCTKDLSLKIKKMRGLDK